MVISGLPIDEKTGTQGLRERKKARRRDEILFHAKALFVEHGIDATTMADIAEAAEVSPPTVFNYFGTKDGLLIALITEGSQQAFARDVSLRPRNDSDFETILIDTLTSVSEGTLNIAGKRVWRYAEASCIRHPETELAEEFRRIDENLCRALAEFLGHYQISLRSGDPADPGFLAALIFDVWTAAFIDFIKDEHQDLAEHQRHIAARVGRLVRMLFDDEFLQHPVLKPKRA